MQTESIGNLPQNDRVTGSADKVMLGPDDRASGSITARRAVFHAGALIDGCWVIEQLKGGHAATSVRRTFRASSTARFSSVGSSTAFGADLVT